MYVVGRFSPTTYMRAYASIKKLLWDEIKMQVYAELGIAIPNNPEQHAEIEKQSILLIDETISLWRVWSTSTHLKL